MTGLELLSLRCKRCRWPHVATTTPGRRPSTACPFCGGTCRVVALIQPPAPQEAMH